MLHQHHSPCIRFRSRRWTNLSHKRQRTGGPASGAPRSLPVGEGGACGMSPRTGPAILPAGPFSRPNPSCSGFGGPILDRLLHYLLAPPLIGERQRHFTAGLCTWRGKSTESLFICFLREGNSKASGVNVLADNTPEALMQEVSLASNDHHTASGADRQSVLATLWRSKP